MTPLISTVLALLLAAFTALALLAMVLLLTVLILLILLAADVLLERNGIDRRSAVLRAWRTLRGASQPASRPADPARATRTPFSARRPAPAPSTPTEPSETASAPRVQAEPAQDDAPTEVLPVTGSTAAPRTARAARTTRAPRTTTPRAPAPAPRATRTGPADPADRNSAIDRLFAPLTESDATEPLPSPGAARPKRSAD